VTECFPVGAMPLANVLEEQGRGFGLPGRTAKASPQAGTCGSVGTLVPCSRDVMQPAICRFENTFRRRDDVIMGSEIIHGNGGMDMPCGAFRGSGSFRVQISLRVPTAGMTPSRRRMAHLGAGPAPRRRVGAVLEGRRQATAPRSGRPRGDGVDGLILALTEIGCVPPNGRCGGILNQW
jgi:hypothetical protein